MRQLNEDELFLISGGTSVGCLYPGPSSPPLPVPGVDYDLSGDGTEEGTTTLTDENSYSGTGSERAMHKVNFDAALSRQNAWNYNTAGLQLGHWIGDVGNGNINYNAYMAAADSDGNRQLFIDFTGDGILDTALMLSNSGELWSDYDQDGDYDLRIYSSNTTGTYTP